MASSPTVARVVLALVALSFPASDAHAQTRRASPARRGNGPTPGAPSPAPPAMRPALMYSCMTVPPGGPPMVDAAVPREIEARSPGWGITRYTDETPPAGWSLWRITGRERVDGAGEHYSFVRGWDGHRVLEGAALFVALGTAPGAAPWQLARRALAVLYARAEQRPIEPARDASTLAPQLAARLAPPAVVNGHLVFWARIEPRSRYAQQVEIELATGREVNGSLGR